MNAFEREKAFLEATTIVCSYPYEVVPITDQAKAAFALYNKGIQGGPIEPTLKQFIAKFLNLKKPAFTGKISFYDEDPSEKVMINRTKDLVIWNMAESEVPGILHARCGKKSFYIPLVEGKDYEIKVGKKIVPEQPEKLTYDDIKAL